MSSVMQAKGLGSQISSRTYFGVGGVFLHRKGSRV